MPLTNLGSYVWRDDNDPDLAEIRLWSSEIEAAADSATAQAAVIIKPLAATSLTLNLANSATYQGTMIVTSAGSAVAITLASDLPVGFNCGVKQGGAGAASFVAGAGVTIESSDGNLTLAGQYAVVGLFVDAAGVVTLG